MNKGIAFLTGVGIGGGLMFMLDPASGRRRRALVRDKATGAWNGTSGVVQKTSRHISNRARGVAHTAKRIVGRAGDVGGVQLSERVRSRIGRVVSHPRAIDVRAEGNRIIVSGPILAAEVDNLLSAIRKVPGVQDVDNRLDVHQTAENIPSLQGSGETHYRTA